MGGKPETVEKLNFTLERVSLLLEKAGVEEWFLGYGTLLGILRDSSCIPHDDDIDIICSEKEYGKIIQVLVQNGFDFSHIYEGILKTKPTEDLVSIDFYFAITDSEGGFYDKWEKVLWENCLPLEVHQWGDYGLNIPNSSESKLKTRYGSDCFEKVKRKHEGGNGIRRVTLK